MAQKIHPSTQNIENVGVVKNIDMHKCLHDLDPFETPLSYGSAASS